MAYLIMSSILFKLHRMLWFITLRKNIMIKIINVESKSI